MEFEDEKGAVAEPLDTMNFEVGDLLDMMNFSKAKIRSSIKYGKSVGTDGSTGNYRRNNRNRPTIIKSEN